MSELMSPTAKGTPEDKLRLAIIQVRAAHSRWRQFRVRTHQMAQLTLLRALADGLHPTAGPVG